VGRSVTNLPPSAENDLIRYGWELVVQTPRHIGKSAVDPKMRFAGNDLACTNCHINAGLKPFAAPFVSTWGVFPQTHNDQVLTLAERINGCMLRSMNGSPLPENGKEMQAFIAYLRFLGIGTPEGVRVPGMGLKRLASPAQTPDATRGQALYTQWCASCHKADGQGEPRVAPGIGYGIPPLWGNASFNAAAGMADIRAAAAFIHANMPLGVTYRSPILNEQQAWDVAAFITSRPRPAGPKAGATK
jgi:thiosulfate dehydrogenase